MSEHETTADVIADKRFDATTRDQFDSAYIVDFCDRLEAAQRSECGDMAKLREALEALLNLAYEVEDMNSDTGPRASIPTKFVIDTAKDALASPPRNCDIAQDWLNDLYVNFKPPASVKREMPPEWVDAVMAFCRWLVAPATEKEGCNDGDK